MKRKIYSGASIMLCVWVLSPVAICRVVAGNPFGVQLTSDRIENAGNILLLALPAATVGVSLINKDPNGILEFGLSMLLSQGVTLGLKNSVHELRPNHHDFLSFPSGHSSTTFTAAEFLWKRYGWEYGIPAMALASFTAYSRVESRNHYFKDVAAGAALGIVSSFIFTKPFHGVQLAPVTDGRGLGVVASVKF